VRIRKSLLGLGEPDIDQLFGTEYFYPLAPIRKLVRELRYAFLPNVHDNFRGQAFKILRPKAYAELLDRLESKWNDEQAEAEAEAEGNYRREAERKHSEAYREWQEGGNPDPDDFLPF